MTDWKVSAVQNATTLFAVIVGAAMTFAIQLYRDRRNEKVEQQKRENDVRAILTSVFSVRNLLAFTLNEISRPLDIYLHTATLITAQKTLHRLEGKVGILQEGAMSAFTNVIMSLDHLLEVSDRHSVLENDSPKRIASCLIKLIQALETLDFINQTTLDFISEEELADIPELQLDELA